MEHLAQDLSIALEESESCGPIALDATRKWGMRRRTRSAGNLRENQSEDSSSSNNEKRKETREPGAHHSDSDDMSTFSIALQYGIYHPYTGPELLRAKHPLQNVIRGRYRKLDVHKPLGVGTSRIAWLSERTGELGMSHSLESDSFNEHSPARPSMRRKRKLKRMSVDETPMPPVGKRKRPPRIDIMDTSAPGTHLHKSDQKIRPLHQSVVDKIEKFCQPAGVDCDRMETQYVNDSCELASESSLSWSGGEGHEGDDELTDWAPSQDTTSFMEQASCNDSDSREFRAGCRRLGDERPGFSISTNANDRVAKFLQDTTKSELRLCGAEREKLSQLAALYSLDLWFEGPTSSLLKKTNRTPCMQPTQRHHSGHTGGYKRIRTQDHRFIT